MVKNSSVAFFLLVSLAACMCGCKLTTQASADYCSMPEATKTITKTQVLHKSDTGEAAYFYLETPEALKDCHATYGFLFRWANPARRVWDESRPILGDLEHSFSPGGIRGLVSYFAHPKEEFKPSSEGAGWYIGFSVGDKNAPDDCFTT
jgi:hypothetical protein